MAEWTDPHTATAMMRAARLEPLEPFVDADTPWRCRCLTCGRAVTTRLSSISAGEGCKYCATRGLELNSPAVIFVLAHPDADGQLVGFDAADGDAIATYAARGAQVFKSASVPTVEEAYAIHAAVLRSLQREGATDVDPSAVWAVVSEELSRRRRRRRAAGGARARR